MDLLDRRTARVLIGPVAPTEDTMKLAQRVISALEVATLDTMPIELIPAPGAGKAIQVVHWGNTVPTFGAPWSQQVNFILAYTDEAGPQLDSLSCFTNQATGGFAFDAAYGQTTGLPTAENQPVVGFIDQHITGGSKRINVSLVYVVIDV